MDSVKRLAVLITLTLSMLGMSAAITGCNTVEGAGEDIEAGGEKIQDAADNDE